MSKKRFVYLFVLLFSLFTFCGTVLAVDAPKVTSSGDLVTVSSTGASFYYVSTSPSFSTAKQMSSNKISLKNGTYYFWARGTGGSNGSLTAAGPTKYVMSQSCTNESKTGQTGSGTVSRCIVVKADGTAAPDDNKSTIVSCAYGYVLSGLKIANNGCTGSTPVYPRYCKATYQYTCKPKTPSGGGTTPGGGGGGTTPIVTTPATLAGLSVSSGSLNPGFSSGVNTYNVAVDSSVSSITVNATAGAGSSFVAGFGPRTVNNLIYGINIIYIKVQNSAGQVNTYSIRVSRADGRSTVNTLSSLTVSTGTLEPAFNPETIIYDLDLPADVSTVDIGATLTDPNSSFAEGFGPRTIEVPEGFTMHYIEVKSESGLTRFYAINVSRGLNSSSSPAVCDLDVDDVALLKEISLVSDDENIKLKQITDFNPKRFAYNIEVPYEIENLMITAYVQEEGDTYEVKNNENLVVNAEQEVSIVVTSKACPSVSKTYKIGVTRKPDVPESSIADLKDIVIKDHDKLNFVPSKMSYKITLAKSDKELEISCKPTDPGTTCTFASDDEDAVKCKAKDDNTAVCKFEDGAMSALGTKIIVTSLSEDKAYTYEYSIEIDDVSKGANGFLIFLLVIIIIGVIIYLILRLLGYKITFNFALLGALVRGISEKIKNIFDK